MGNIGYIFGYGMFFTFSIGILIGYITGYKIGLSKKG